MKRTEGPRSILDIVKPLKDGKDGKTTKEASAARARLVREARARQRRTPTCHPDRVQLGETGLCHECYMGRHAKQLDVREALALIEKHGDPAEVARLRETALAILQENLPEYARIHMEGAKMAALKGDTKPAEWALTTIKNGQAAPVVEPPTKVAPGTGGVKVIVGVNLGGITPGAAPSNVVEADVRALVDAPATADGQCQDESART